MHTAHMRNSYCSRISEKRIKVHIPSFAGTKEMKLRDLEEILGDVDPFDTPKVELEQYPTSPHIASRMIFSAANTFGDIEGQTVGDFGCGAGMLTIASNVLGSSHTVGFDVDQDALDNAWVNCRKLDIYDIDLVQLDLLSIKLAHGKCVRSSIAWDCCAS